MNYRLRFFCAISIASLAACGGGGGGGSGTPSGGGGSGAADTTAPVISLLGDASLVVEQGRTYEDAGATASDAVDGSLTTQIEVVNGVDTSSLGSYSVTYNVSDAAGNDATQVVRSVEVVNWTPGDVSATEHGDSSVALSWTEEAGLSYNIYRSSESDCDLENYAICADSDYLLDQSSGFSDSGLTSGTSYYYWLEASMDGNNIQVESPQNVTAVSVTQLSVNLEDYVDDTLPITAEDSEDYVAPNPTELSAFDGVLTPLMDRSLSAASQAATSAGLELIQVTDETNFPGEDVYCLRETSLQGRGFYCVNYEGSLTTHISAPHPKFDTDTGLQAVVVAAGTDARYFSISTTHRCANAAASACSGTTSACGASEPFKVSDMAHNVDTFFHDFSVRIHDSESSLTTVQLHGCGSSACPSNRNASDIVARVSAGTTEEVADSFPANQLKNEIDQTVDTLISASAKSCNEIGEADDQLCGTTNPTGRYINGVSTDPCTTAATNLSHRFIHLEQNFDLRHDDQAPLPDTINRQIVVDALNEVLD